MRRTQIYLPDDVHQYLSQEAREKQLTMSELIRRRIFQKKTKESQIETRLQAFKELERLGRTFNWEDTPKNLSEKIDETLYGNS